jgi:hypothetical protein
VSPELVGAFEKQWPEIARRLTNLLASKNVPTCKRDDIVQETGLRLFKMWEKVDRARPVWPLTVTIALNLLRDEARRNPEREVLGPVPDVPTAHDVEHEGLARIELERVQQALAQLSPAHRDVLLNEITSRVEVPQDARNATKMMRLRARRALTTLLETAALRAGLMHLKLRRSLGLNDPFLPFKLGGTETSAAASATALAIAALLVGTMQAQPPSVAHAAESPNTGATQNSDELVTQTASSPGELHNDLEDAVETMRAQALAERRARLAASDRKEQASRQNRTGGGATRDAGRRHDWGAPPPPASSSPIEVPLPIGEAYAGGGAGAGLAGAQVGEKEGNPAPACVSGVEPGSLGCGTETPETVTVEAGATLEAGGEEVTVEVEEEIDPKETPKP